MELVKESCIGRLALLIYALCRESAVGALLHRFCNWCGHKWHESALICFLTREGTLPRSWPSSVSCRLLGGILNLPANLLHRWYLAWQKTFDGSFFANLAFDMGDSTAIAASWLMALLLIIPYERWNNAYSLLGFFLCLCLLILGGMRRKSLRIDVPSLGPYLVLFGAAVLLSLPLSHYRSLSARFLLYHLACMICVLVTVSAVRNVRDLLRLAGGAGIAVTISSAYAFVQRIQGVEVNESYVDMTLNAGMPGRVYSFFDNPNAFAELLLFFLPVLLALVLCARHWYSKLAAFAAFCLGTGAILMTYSRASWIGLAFSIVVFVFLWNPRLIPVLALLALACVPFLPDTILNRISTITNLNDSSTSSRFPLYGAAFRLLKESPIRGAGLGTSAVQQFIQDNSLYRGTAPFVHAHDIYLQVWAEMGLLGVTGFVSGMLWSYKSAAAAVKHASPAARLLTLGGASAIAGAMVCAIADYLWNYPRVMCAFWFLVAITVSGIKVCRKEQQVA